MAFDYEHMNLIPRECTVDSRAECNTTIQFGKYTFRMPIVPANMECVIDFNIAERLASNHYFYILHRFYTDAQVVEFAQNMKAKGLFLSISIGVNNESYRLIEKLKEINCIPEFLTIDIAHGHAQKMERMLKWLNSIFDVERPFIIAGNVCTRDGVKALSDWGADAIKVGIGPGSACTTYPTTGFGSRGIQASTIRECCSSSSKPIIADGGIKEPGDIVKSLVLGATMCMVGGMFSSLIDSPGSTILGSDGRYYKEFWGSASASQSGKTSRIEGVKKMNLMTNRTILQEMKYLEECLQSAISYGGGNSLQDLKDVCFITKKL